jgi:colicin import membrane protein
MIAKAKDAIQKKVRSKWFKPPVDSNLKCTVRVRLSSDGSVIDVEIVKSSGDEVFDQSVENAVNSSSPLPVPSDKELFAREFKSFTFNFKFE